MAKKKEFPVRKKRLSREEDEETSLNRKLIMEDKHEEKEIYKRSGR